MSICTHIRQDNMNWARGIRPIWNKCDSPTESDFRKVWVCARFVIDIRRNRNQRAWFAKHVICRFYSSLKLTTLVENVDKKIVYTQTKRSHCMLKHKLCLKIDSHTNRKTSHLMMIIIVISSCSSDEIFFTTSSSSSFVVVVVVVSVLLFKNCRSHKILFNFMARDKWMTMIPQTGFVFLSFKPSTTISHDHR